MTPGYLEAAAMILAAIAWPIAVVSLVLAFRRPLTRALNGLLELRFGSTSVRFEREGGEVARSVVRSVTEPRTDGASVLGAEVESLSERYADLAAENPLSAILKAYSAIEEWADANLPEHGVESRDGTSKRGVLPRIREAVSKGILPASSVDQVAGLSVMRDLAAHGPAERVTPDNAREFLTLADAVIYALGFALKRR